MKKIIPVLVIMSITIPAFAGSDKDGDSTGLKIASVVAMLAVLLLAIRKLNGMKKDRTYPLWYRNIKLNILNLIKIYMVNEYKIFSDILINQLELSVKTAIKEGWQPLGGVAVVHTDIKDDVQEGELTEGIVFLQAMVK